MLNVLEVHNSNTFTYQRRNKLKNLGFNKVTPTHFSRKDFNIYILKREEIQKLDGIEIDVQAIKLDFYPDSKELSSLSKKCQHISLLK
jgi:hypothetical protein